MYGKQKLVQAHPLVLFKPFNAGCIKKKYIFKQTWKS